MLRNEIRAASADDLAEERDPSRVLVFAKHYGRPSEEPFDIGGSPKLTFALLRAVRGEMETGSFGSRTVRRSAVLNWERLIDLYGSKEVLETRFNDLEALDSTPSNRGSRPAGYRSTRPNSCLNWWTRYLSGRRPEAN